MGLMKLKNTYFLLRHGESRPNMRGVIVSGLRDGKKWRNTLTKHGRDQVAASVREAKEAGMLDATTVIYSSPFSRCARTAAIARRVLGAKGRIVFDDRLRERWFGDWEGTSSANYTKVWDADMHDPRHGIANVESAAAVRERARGFVEDLEGRYEGRNILLVSHGDILQIMQTFFEERPASEHRMLAHLRVAEVRKID